MAVRISQTLKSVPYIRIGMMESVKHALVVVAAEVGPGSGLGCCYYSILQSISICIHYFHAVIIVRIYSHNMYIRNAHLRAYGLVFICQLSVRDLYQPKPISYISHWFGRSGNSKQSCHITIHNLGFQRNLRSTHCAHNWVSLFCFKSSTMYPSYGE